MNAHTIRTQRMELTFSSEARADELHALVRDLCSNEVERAICGSLDRFNSLESIVYSFKKIELDLGEIEMSDLKKQLPERVSLKLQNVLKEAFVESKPDAEMRMSVTHDTDLSSIVHFLQHGFLPWNTTNRTLIKLLLETITNRATELASSIRQVGVSNPVRIRMTERFPSEILQKIVSVLEPEHAGTIVAYHGYLTAVNKKESIVNVPQSELEKALWLFVFNHLLTEQDSDFNRRTFAVSMLRQFSCHFNIEFNDLVRLIRTGWQRWKGDIPPPFKNLLDELVANSTSSIPHDLRFTSGEAANSEHFPNEGILPAFRTLDDLLGNSSWELVISDLINTAPHQFLSLLKNTNDKPRAIHKMVSKSSPFLPQQILKKIEPVESTTIVKYHSNLVALHASDPIPNTTQREVENILWTFMIVHIAENQESYFNHKSFLKSLITSFSSHYNLNEADLLDKLISSAHLLPAQSASMRRFLSIMKEIYHDLTEHVQQVRAKKSRTTNYVVAGEIAVLLHPNAADIPDSRWEAELMHALNTDGSAIAKVKESLGVEFVRQRISSFSVSSFEWMAKHFFSSSTIALVNQFVLLTARMESQLISFFGTESHYNKAVRLSVLAAAATTERVSHDKLFNLMLRSFVDRTPKLNLKQVQTCASVYQGDRQLYLLKKFIKPAHQANSTLSSMIAQLINGFIDPTIGGNSEASLGFASQQEALKFIQERYPQDFRKTLAEFSLKKRKEFVTRLNSTAIDTLLAGTTEKKSSWCLGVLHTWEKKLLGYNNRGEILASLKRALLLGFLLQESPSVDVLAHRWIQVLDKHHLPDSFYEALAAWSLPRFGDASNAIQSIERKVIGGNDKKLKRSEKANAVKEILREAQRKKHETERLKSEEQKTEEIYIGNAGLVLVHPYLPYLFEQCGLTQDGKFINSACKRRAVAMLHYAATGTESCKEEEHVLYKILCGMDIHENSAAVKLRKKDKKMTNEMLMALTEHWTIIKNSTADDVRGNWLVREGRLKENEEYWELIVKRQPYDLLMDSLPFTLSPVKHSWMKKMILIQWL